MAIVSWADSTKAVLAETYAGRFDIWYVQKYPRGVTWCARRTGEPTACINVDSPEALVSAIADLESPSPGQGGTVIPIMRKYAG